MKKALIISLIVLSIAFYGQTTYAIVDTVIYQGEQIEILQDQMKTLQAQVLPLMLENQELKQKVAELDVSFWRVQGQTNQLQEIVSQIWILVLDLFNLIKQYIIK